MGFPTSVPLYPAPGIPGTQASANPISTVDAGTGALTTGANGLTVANFGWITGTTNLGGGVANNAITGAPIAPDGFVMNHHTALITTWLGQASMVIPQGLPCTLADRGDFWAIANSAPAVRGNKVFANLFNGSVLAAAAGAVPVTSIGTNAAFTASVATNVMTVTAVASGTLAVGQLIQGVGIPANTYIQSLGTGTGGTGTYNLNTTPGTVTSGALTATSPAGVGGASYTASIATNVLTVTAVAYGILQVGMFVVGVGVAAGTYISSLGTGTGGAGTYNLSTAPGAQVSATYTASAWIETPFYVKSDANPGELIKIGVRN